MRVVPSHEFTRVFPSYYQRVPINFDHLQARDTPEPEFDLSDCKLEELPSGVFVLCRVLRKERLLLNKNQLRYLNGGGSLTDLRQLHTLDLSSNRFTKVPIVLNLRVSESFLILWCIELIQIHFFICCRN